MRYLKLTIAYDGTAYCGWQIQNGDVSIQEKLELSWQKVTGEKIRITASGRTDGGVHAEAQVCSLMTESQLDNASLVRALNAETPYDLAVLAVEDAPTGFHAIRDAVGKTYRYQIQYGRIRDPLRRRFWWYVPRELDVDAMRQGASYLIGQHDFASFQSAGAERSSTIRTVTKLELLHRDPRPRSLDPLTPAILPTASQFDRDRHLECDWFPTIILTISADGFLYKMVRNIVGSLVRVGERRESPEWIAEVLAQCNRQAAGQAAPANGLFMQRVWY
jgi:tRNA pseudouridine38-40 synthase